MTLSLPQRAGWWLVEGPGSEGTGRKLGYIPGSFLRRNELQSTVEMKRECLGFVSSLATEEFDSSPKYVAIDDYFPDDSRQVSFFKGEQLVVVEKSEDGELAVLCCVCANCYGPS